MGERVNATQHGLMHPFLLLLMAGHRCIRSACDRLRLAIMLALVHMDYWGSGHHEV